RSRSRRLFTPCAHVRHRRARRRGSDRGPGCRQSRRNRAGDRTASALGCPHRRRTRRSARRACHPGAMRVESALRYDRAPAVVMLILLPVVSWMWIVVMGRDMYGPMTGASAWMMTPVWDTRHLALLWAMWAVMMAGMMLPSASPLFLLYGSVARRSTAATSVM